MKRLLPILFVLALCGPCQAQDITLPPKVEGDPGIPIQIAAAYKGKNVVWKAPDKGLVVIDGGFFAGDSGKALLFGPSGTYRLWAFTSVKDVVSSAECVVVIRGPPVPPVPPVPVPPGPNPPGPTPGPLAKLVIVVIEETAQASADRAAYINNKELQDRIKAKGHTWKLADQDAKDPQGNTPPSLAPYIAEAKKHGLPYLFLVNRIDDKTGEVRYQGALPKTPAELVKLIEQVGG